MAEIDPPARTMDRGAARTVQRQTVTLDGRSPQELHHPWQDRKVGEPDLVERQSAIPENAGKGAKGNRADDALTHIEPSDRQDNGERRAEGVDTSRSSSRHGHHR